MRIISLLVLLSVVMGCKNKTTEDPAPKNYDWTGKKIVWCGTSIPWGYGEQSYPNQIGRYLGAQVYNTAISGSTLVFFPADSTLGILGSPGMAGTWEQQIAAGFQHPYSYMSRIFEYEADLIVIDHGQNDLNWIKERLGELESRDIGTFYGAMNTVIDAVKLKYPSVPILLCTPPVEFIYKGQVPDKVIRQQLLGDAIRNTAKYQNIYLWDVMYRSGITIDNQDRWTTDYMHPNQEKVDSLAIDGTKFIRETIEPLQGPQ